MKPNNRTFTRHQQADLLILLALSSLVAWYLHDAYSASSHFANLILILPVSVLVLILCALDFINQLRGLHKPPPKLEPISSMLPAITLFVLFVLSLEWLGFDVGTFTFISAFLWLHGERRIKWILAYSVSFALLISLFFSAMLPYPLPMLILPSAY